MSSPVPSGAARLLSERILVPLLLAALLLCLIAWRPEIVSPRNLRLLVIDMLPLLAVAIGQTIVVIAGGIDLSITAIISLASVVGASLVTVGSPLANHPLGVPTAVLAMLMIGMAIGAAHGISVAVLHMPPFLVTLASLMVFSGLTVWWTGGDSISALPSLLIELGYGGTWGVPYALMITGSLTLVAWFELRQTMYGRWLYATGQNATAARVSGVPVRRVVVLAYVASGFCASIAGLLYAARLETARADLVPKELLLDCVGAVVIGGASLFGGRGTIAGTTLGVLFITLVGNSLTLSNLDYWHVLMVKGGLILLAAFLDVLRHREST
jgi:ribose/xylose/arabinose/galactoside ABC-type transport system permease subunit